MSIEDQLRTLLADPAPDPDAMAQAYLEAGAALARARSDPAEGWREERLEVLVGRAHARIFRTPTPTRARLWRFVHRGWAEHVRRQARETGIAAAIFIGAAIVAAGASLLGPGASADLLPREVLAAIEAQRGAVTWGTPGGMLDVAGLFAHNARAAVEACALGALFGVGSVWSLARNGVFTGAVLAAAWTQGDGQVLVCFMLTHGVLEFPAIFLAGGAGLRLGGALLGPGDRRAAMRAESGRAVRVLAGVLVLLAAAAVIEGIVSPRVEAIGQALGAATLAGGVLAAILWRGVGAAEAQ